MTDLRVRTYAFAAIIVLALSLPNAFAQEQHPGDKFVVNIQCKNNGTNREFIEARNTQASGFEVVEYTGRFRGWVNPGDSFLATYQVRVRFDTQPGTYTLIFGCYADSQVIDSHVENVRVVEEAEEGDEDLESPLTPESVWGEVQRIIPGFPWESIVTGIVIGLGVLVIKRRHRQGNQ